MQSQGLARPSIENPVPSSWTQPASQYPAAPPNKKRKTGWIIGAVMVFVLFIGGGAFAVFAMLGSDEYAASPVSHEEFVFAAEKIRAVSGLTENMRREVARASKDDVLNAAWDDPCTAVQYAAEGLAGMGEYHFAEFDWRLEMSESAVRQHGEEAAKELSSDPAALASVSMVLFPDAETLAEAFEEAAVACAGHSDIDFVKLDDSTFDITWLGSGDNHVVVLARDNVAYRVMMSPEFMAGECGMWGQLSEATLTSYHAPLYSARCPSTE